MKIKKMKKKRRIINNIEKKKIKENSDKYIVLFKDNELLNQDIEQLRRELEMNQLNKKTRKKMRTTRLRN